MSATVITGIGELVTNAPAAATSSAPSRTRPWSSRARPSPGSAPPPTRRRPTSRSTSGGRAVLPGFVDSHSHLVFAGDRSAEFAARMAGEPYAAGGIRTTVAATRAATDEQLTSHVGRLVQEMRRQGTTTVEIKSGYGLTVHDEARSLAVARQFTEETTFLGAHVVPDGTTPEEYVALVTGPMLEACAPHARWVDAFCERGAFDADQARAVLEAGAAAGLRGRLHANQLGAGTRRTAGRRAGPHRRRPLHLPHRRRRRRAPRRRHHRDAAPRGRVLDPPALSRRAPAARRRRPGRPGHRLQPRLLLHQLHAAVHRAGRARDGDDPRRGGVRRHRDRRGRPRPRRRRRPRARPAGRPRRARRPEPRPPGLPPRRTPRHRHLARRPSRPD